MNLRNLLIEFSDIIQDMVIRGKVHPDFKPTVKMLVRYDLEQAEEEGLLYENHGQMLETIIVNTIYNWYDRNNVKWKTIPHIRYWDPHYQKIKDMVTNVLTNNNTEYNEDIYRCKVSLNDIFKQYYRLTYVDREVLTEIKPRHRMYELYNDMLSYCRTLQDKLDKSKVSLDYSFLDEIRDAVLGDVIVYPSIERVKQLEEYLKTLNTSLHTLLIKPHGIRIKEQYNRADLIEIYEDIYQFRTGESSFYTSYENAIKLLYILTTGKYYE